MTVKTYFVGVFISKPTKEHAGIKDELQRLSNGDYEFVHFHQMGVFAVLNTEKNAGQIDDAISRSTTNDDRRIVMEVAHNWHSFGLNKAAYWLQNHLPK